jgi:FlaA1/EpsC-like NDP-sugar epimerase
LKRAQRIDAYLYSGDDVKDHPDHHRPSEDTTTDDNGFQGVLAFGRLRDGFLDLHRNGPGFAHFACLHDICMASISITVALLIVPGNLIDGGVGVGFEADILVFTLLATVAFVIFRPYRSLWRYTSLPDLVSILTVSTIVVLSYLTIDRTVGSLSVAEWGTYINAWLFMVVLMSGPRVGARLAAEPNIRTKPSGRDDHISLLLLGAGDATELFLRALGRDPESRFRVVGIVDEMGANFRRSIHGVEVLGSPGNLETVVRKLDRKGNRPSRLVITEEHLSPASLKSMLEEAERLGLTLSRIPRLTELRAGIDQRIEVKPIAIEDLLGRPQTLLDRGSMRDLCHGARVLVTGAGGTIGSELVRQISAFSPEEIILVDNSEFHLYGIDMEVAERFPDVKRSVVMADVRDRSRVFSVFEKHQPALVFHAAAMKHVPMVEMHPSEGVLTNIRGTRNIADAARAAGVSAMVLISTDKAVNPTSVMGATKRVAECYCQAMDIDTAPENGTRFLTVRFGNVLGSTGSVVPLFQKQLAVGGPLTVTHPAVTRYFMTTREAVALVLQASALGTRSQEHRGSIYTLEMGSAVRIQDLARQMIRLAGLRPGEDIDIVYTGLRPGEKLYEEPLHQSEELLPTEVEGILLASPRTADFVMLERLITKLIDVAEISKVDEALKLIRTVVPEYTPTANKDGALVNSYIPVEHRSIAKNPEQDGAQLGLA